MILCCQILIRKQGETELIKWIYTSVGFLKPTEVYIHVNCVSSQNKSRFECVT